jgi:hypothetical protein
MARVWMSKHPSTRPRGSGRTFTPKRRQNSHTQRRPMPSMPTLAATASAAPSPSSISSQIIALTSGLLPR